MSNPFEGNKTINKTEEEPKRDFEVMKAHYERNGIFRKMTIEEYNQLPAGTLILTINGTITKKDESLTKKIEELKSEGITNLPYGFSDKDLSQEAPEK